MLHRLGGGMAFCAHAGVEVFHDHEIIEKCKTYGPPVDGSVTAFNQGQ